MLAVTRGVMRQSGCQRHESDGLPQIHGFRLTHFSVVEHDARRIIATIKVFAITAELKWNRIGERTNERTVRRWKVSVCLRCEGLLQRDSPREAQAKPLANPRCVRVLRIEGRKETSHQPLRSWAMESEEPMTTPIELPCICHVPTPKGTVRIEIRKPKKGEWFWNDDSGDWEESTYDYEINRMPVAIIAPQYIYPTPVEACRMIADAGGPIECEFSDIGFEDRKVTCGRCEGIVWRRGELLFQKMNGLAWKKIRVLKPNA